MLSLTKIYLHNWHRFQDHLIEVQDSLYLAGHNGSGKSSVLDALQVVLIAGLNHIHFNSSAQDHSTRNLDTYVRGKIGENRWLRPGNTVAYIALEFGDRRGGTRTTLGVCIEAGADKQSERTYFILPDLLDQQLFMLDGRPLTRRELKQQLKSRRGAKSFDQIGEYQDELLNRLGGLNPRFFDLFLRALTFQPIRNIRGFVEQWLLEAQPLDVGSLQQVKERLDDLRRAAQEVQERLDALRGIIEQQNEARRLRDLYAQHTLLGALLRVEAAQSRRAQLEEEGNQVRRQIAQGEVERTTIEAALKGAQDALLESQIQLRQLDVVRRRDELQKQVQNARREADEIRKRWEQVRRELDAEVRALASLPQMGQLTEPEEAAVHALLSAIEGLRQGEIEPSTLAQEIDHAVPILDEALPRAQHEEFKLREQVRNLRERGETIERELAQLRSGGTTYCKEIERLRELLTPVAGARPPLLCEQLEIPDARWQDAVEALLGARRFTLLVPPEHFDSALRVLDDARAREGLYDVRLLDLAKAASEGRPAQPNSLALHVSTEWPALRAYIDTVLGDIITCDSLDQLRRHRRAVTREVVVYAEWTVRAVPPRDYRPWFIGAQAQRSQIEMREKELRALGEQLANLAPQAEQLKTRVQQLQRGRNLSLLRQRLDQPLDERPLQAQIFEMESELQALDLSGAQALEREVARLQEIVTRESDSRDRLLQQIARWQTDVQRLNEEWQNARLELAQYEVQAGAERAKNSAVVIAGAEDLLAARLTQPDLNEALRNAESAARGYSTRAENVLERLIEMATGYNTRYQFAALARDPAEPRYVEEERRLAATELPRYHEQIAHAQAEAEEELREHVLHRLREQILRAKQELARINDSLGGLDFHGERYRFVSSPADETHVFYNLIMEAQVVGKGSLFESQFYHDHQAVFDQFYDALTSTPTSDHERAEQESLSDYRRYLNYDIAVTHPDSQSSRLSKIMDQTSGGETQTPFYLTIAASFVQLYHINERSTRPTIRLVAFDEAFSKMDQDRIGSTLDLFQHFGLQIITATPLERCEYLVPKMCTNLVLTAIGDTVLIEPYRNYAARLEEN